MSWLWVKTNGTSFGEGAPPILVYLSGDWAVHWDNGWDPSSADNLRRECSKRTPGAEEFCGRIGPCSSNLQRVFLEQPYAGDHHHAAGLRIYGVQKGGAGSPYVCSLSSASVKLAL